MGKPISEPGRHWRPGSLTLPRRVRRRTLTALLTFLIGILGRRTVNKRSDWTLRSALGFACALVLAAFIPAASAASCPNESLREGQGATSLPDCMALEMVSPPQKSSQPAYLPFFSREGGRLQLIIQTALSDTPGYQYYGGDRYVATRGAAGWTISPTSPQDPAVSAGGPRWGSPAPFTPTLDRWVQVAATQPQYNIGVAQLYRGGLDGSFSPLSPSLVPIDDSGAEMGSAILNLQITGASADLSAAVLRVTLASTGYFPEDPRNSSSTGEPGGDRNHYVAFLDESGEPSLELLARDKEGTVYGGRCGAHPGGPGATFTQGIISPTFNQGAISPEGSRIYFSTRPAQPWDPGAEEEPVCDVDNGLRVLERTATSTGPVIEEIAPGGGGPAAPGDDLFQAASANGSKVYLLTPRKLTASDTDGGSGPCSGNLGASDGCDLYLYDASKPEGERITLASSGAGSEEADVLNSTTAISGDGSHAYFVAQGVLTADANPEGDSAQPGAPNLYLYEAETDALSFIATLSAGDAEGMWDTKGTGFGDAYATPLYGPDLQGGGDGHVLAFASKAALTADDEDGGFRDVFRYDAEAEALERVSRAPEGGSDNGPFDATVNPTVLRLIEYNFGEAIRWVSEDGQIIAFATKEALLPNDEDGATNPYAWDAGQLGAAFAEVTEAPAAAPVGGQIAFSTPTRLLPTDGDVAKDVYVARRNGGFPLPVEPIICDPLKEGSCQGPPSPPPGPVPLSANGANVKEPLNCKKGQVKRRGKCVKKRSGKRKGARRAGKRGSSR